MEIKKIGVGRPVEVAGVKLVPVLRTTVNHRQRHDRVSFFASQQPVSLLVIAPSGPVAFSMNGERVPIEELIKQVPEIKAVL